MTLTPLDLTHNERRASHPPWILQSNPPHKHLNAVCPPIATRSTSTPDTTAMERLAQAANDLYLGSSSSATALHHTRHERRSSDGIRDAPSATGVLHISSKDLARRLPKPDEQTHKRPGPYPWPAREKVPPPSFPIEPHLCTAANCSITNVFGTAELLDLILGYLDTANVVNLRRTSRIWSRAVQESPFLRLHLFTRPQWERPASDFQLLDLRIPGLAITRGEPVDRGRWIYISMNVVAARAILPTGRSARRPRARSIFEGMRGGLGLRSVREGAWPAQTVGDPSSSMLLYEELYVAQPPILGIQAFLNELKSPDPREVGSLDEEATDEDDIPCAIAKLSCDAGITLDFLADTTLSLLSDRRETAEKDGRSVVFKAIVSFCKPNSSHRKRGTARSVIRIG